MHLAAVFPTGLISDIAHPIFNCPVSPPNLRQLRGQGFLSTQAGETIGDGLIHTSRFLTHSTTVSPQHLCDARWVSKASMIVTVPDRVCPVNRSGAAVISLLFSITSAYASTMRSHAAPGSADVPTSPAPGHPAAPCHPALVHTRPALAVR